MKFDYKEFRIDASPLDEGGHCYARAKIYRCASARREAVEVYAYRRCTTPAGAAAAYLRAFSPGSPARQIWMLLNARQH